MATSHCRRAGLLFAAVAALLPGSQPTAAQTKPQPATSSCTLRVLDAPEDDKRYSFYLRLLELILARTEATYGPCNLVKVEPVSHSRKFRMIQKNELDIIWNVATTELETDLLPVRIPVHHGLHGVRLLLIRKGDEERFTQVSGLDKLRPLNAGLVHDWQVADVLEGNALPVTRVQTYDSLYLMLQRQRIDYIALNLFEAYWELDHHSAEPVVIAPKLVLHYDSLDFYYVPKDRPVLAKRLSDGLDQVLADNSGDELFERTFGMQKILQRADLASRSVIELHNPDQLTDLTAPYRPQIWSIDTLIKRSLETGKADAKKAPVQPEPHAADPHPAQPRTREASP